MRPNTKRAILAALAAGAALSGCGRMGQVGREPGLTSTGGAEHFAMAAPMDVPKSRMHRADPASLWTGAPSSLFGDRRATQRGDILTVVIEIDESAEFDNSSERSRSSRQNLGVGSLFGLPERFQDFLPDGVTLEEAAQITSQSGFDGDGSISRNERLELRVAATVTDVLPNGALRIQGTQEVRLNNEVRVLLVTGFVRPMDVNRVNEITYDKIASARISYGGRGLLTDVQRPRRGQEIADIVLPF